MRHVAIVSLLGLSACAGSGPGGSAPAPASQSVQVVGPTGTSGINIPGSSSSNVQNFPYSADQVYRALGTAFDSLGIPVTTMDAKAHAIGNEGFAIRHRLKSAPLSRYIDCGSSQLGPSADDYDVRLSVMAEVHASDGGSTLTTTVQATARPVNYAQDYSSCSSRGTLEARLIGFVKMKLPK